MLSDTKHLALTEHLFRDTVVHLLARLARVKTVVDPDGDDVETTNESRQILLMEMCVYRLCLDAVREQRMSAEGMVDQAIVQKREQFLRLMAAAAQCEMRRDQHVLSVGFASPSVHDRPMSDAQMFEDISRRAQTTLQELAGV